MAKTNISMPDGMLEDVDRRAAQAGVTRSAFIQEAIAHYGSELDARRKRDARAARIDEALGEMRSLSLRVGAPDAERVIRSVRDSGPRWERA